MVVGMGIPRPVDLERTGGLATIGVAQVRENAAVLALELLDWIEWAGEQTGHPRVQRSAGDEQQREAGTGLIITDADGTSFIELGHVSVSLSSQARFLIHASGIIPVHHWVNGPTSRSYLRANVSLPSCPIRNTVRPAGMSTTLPSSRRALRDSEPATSNRPPVSSPNVRGCAARMSAC